MYPIRCLSSHLTTELLKYRNPLRGERDWPDHSRLAIGSYPRYHKVIAAEIGLSLLCVTATVESVAYTILAISSVPLLLVSNRAWNWSTRLLSSSAFTVFWNIGNLTTFNLFFNNIFTDESFARFCMDHMEEGNLCKSVIKIALLTGIVVLSVLSRTSIHLHDIDRFMDSLEFFRPEDRLHIIHHYNYSAHLNNLNLRGQANRHVQQLRQILQSNEQSIAEGTAFLQKYFLESIEIDDSTKVKIRECDAESGIYSFVLTRSVFIYTFGPEKDTPLPSFLKSDTRQLIDAIRDELREKYKDNQDQIREKLEPLMQDLEEFNKEIPSAQTPQDRLIKAVFDDLKRAAHTELQASIFITTCWQKACYPQGMEEVKS